MTLKRQSLPVAELLRDVSLMMTPLASRRSIGIDVVAAHHDLRVDGDYQRLLRIFSNLIGNAVKFSTEGARIGVSARSEPDRVVFEVADQGRGIAREQLARIFDRFWQADSHDVRGAGLGLSIVRSLVQAHGGDIVARSEVGVGSIFIFDIPASR